MPKIYFILFAVLVTLPCVINARVVPVSRAADINNGIWQAGDTLQLTGGQWTDQQIVLRGEGTAKHPIVLTAPTTGSVVMTGSSTLTMEGSYLESRSLLFAGTFTGESAIVTFSRDSRHCRLTKTEIRSYNMQDATKDSKWVSLYGQDNRVDYCTFSDKTNSGTLLVVWLENGK